MPGKLTFGYLYDFRNPPQWRRPWADVYKEAIDVAVWSEGIGFGGAWVPEHHLSSDGYLPSPLAVISAMATRTKRIRLGTWIALAPLYHPMRFASDCAVLDIICEGRLDAGLAIGYRPTEYAAMGVDFTKRGRLFDEWLEIVTKLWAGGKVSYAGEHYQLDDVQLMPPAPNSRIPIFIGAFAPKAMDRVLAYADGYVGSVEGAELYVQKLREQGKDMSEGKVRLGDFYTLVARDPEQAMEELAPHFLHVNNAYAEWGGEGMDWMSLDDFKASGKLQILTPDAAIAKYKGLQERMPLDHVCMMMPAGLPAKRFMPYAQLFADEVLPAFK
ncbi:LLM class flavin-dependent oxidoreductase [Sphingobium sp. AN641]|uniref:LLM class flavin-dependent oxidoreductase n=1 Tax=Sphingobium sp. AN641 TaxID=3133443 RepID=UPI0030BD84A6